MKGFRPFKSNPSPFEGVNKKESQREAKPLLHNQFPLMIGIYIHIMERGTQGVR